MNRKLVRCWPIFAFSSLLWSAMTVPVSAQSLEAIKDLHDTYNNAKSVYDDTKKLFTNNQKCRERGGSKKMCAALALFCYMQEKKIGSHYPSFISKLQIFDSFKLDCGNGVCFQCCYVPNKGCHTSFVGYPVINCNSRYGVGTMAAGLTQIVNPNAKPGQACISTPQTCEHIPLCHYKKGKDIGALEKKLAQGGPHPLNWPRSVKQRAREVAKELRSCWRKYINNYSTEKTSLTSLLDTITGRGCVEWQHKVSKIYPFKWDDPLFAVKDTKGKVNIDASQLNALLQLSMFRLLGSVPNFYNRLASVDSRVWTETSKKTYLSKVKDPDAALLRHMSSHLLRCFKSNQKMQDYKLLAIPLPKEKKVDEFHGCTLGKAPLVTATYTQDGSHGIRLIIQLLETGQRNSKLPTNFPVFVVWGDGHTEKLRWAPNTKLLSASHQYSKGGRYLVQTILQNNSGLRGFHRIVVATQASSSSVAPPFVPDIGKVHFEDLTMHVATLTGNSSTRQFRLWSRDAQKKEHLIGLTPVKEVDLFKPTRFTTLTGHNPSGFTIKTLVIKTLSVGGFATGLREKYYTVKQLSFDIYATSKNGFVTHRIKLTPTMLKVYPQGGTTPLAPSAIQQTSGGLLKIPVMKRVSNKWVIYDRVEIELTAAMFKGFSLPPLQSTQTWKAGTNASWKEIRPGFIQFTAVCGNKMKEPGEACDDGNRQNGDQCTETCQLASPSEPGPEPRSEPTMEANSEPRSEPTMEAKSEPRSEPTMEAKSEPSEKAKRELTTEPAATSDANKKEEFSSPKESEQASASEPTIRGASPDTSSPTKDLRGTVDGCSCESSHSSFFTFFFTALLLLLGLVQRQRSHH